MTSHGMFAWNELLTEDTDTAKEFYQELLGWESQDIEMPEGAYTLFRQNGTDAAGMMGMHGEEWEGAPPHWMGHIAVDNVDECIERAEESGAEILFSPTDAPGTGRFSVFTDPVGASVTLVKFEEPEKFEYSMDHGRFCWNELYTEDPETAKDFYGEVLGWDFRIWEDGDYILASTPEADTAGIVDMGSPDFEQSPPPHWACYIAVDDIDAISRKAEELGGKIHHGPADIPEVGRFAVIQDPTGAMVYLMTFAESSKED